MAELAIELAEEVIEVLGELPVAVEKPDAEKSPGELLREGLVAGLIVGRDVCRRTITEETDIKLQRLVIDTAAWMCRLGARIAEAEMRRQGVSEGLSRVLKELALEEKRR